MKRKKWTEEEEKSLIKKYGEMISDGTLFKMKTREKKYRPIAVYVNAVHHEFEPCAYPWQWTWKDVSTKIQNMRHQYLLVKQKIKKSDLSGKETSGAGGSGMAEEFDWVEGLTHWSNFLAYKKVFGDVSIGGAGSELLMHWTEDKDDQDDEVSCRETEIQGCGHVSNPAADFIGIGDVDDGVMEDLSFDFDGSKDTTSSKLGAVQNHANEESVPVASIPRKNKRLKLLERRPYTFIIDQLQQLRDMEARFEQSEAEREQERKERDNARLKQDQEWDKKLEEMERRIEEKEKSREQLRQKRVLEWEAVQKELEERERRQVEDEITKEREWVDRMNTRRKEWRERIDGMLNQHRTELNQVHNRILNEQQNLMSQYLGIFAHWTGHMNLSDQFSANNEYISQVVQNLHHLNGMVHEDTPVGGDAQDNHFIVDG